MARIVNDRIKRQLGQAEGYLMLNLPERALEILQARSEWATMQFEASLLAGEALRALGRFREALRPLEVALGLHPDDLGVSLALGWCYKRTHRLAQAIDVLERAARVMPDQPLLHYNLACYWSLAGNSARTLNELTRALELEPDLRAKVADEPDFDAVRGDPSFARLAVGPAPFA
jgi:tetratricopeptide (TPR) repeat protein